MEEIKIIPLGTVSPYPRENNNCPGYLVKLKYQKILLDCGNGITRLLNLPSDLENLNIVITHYHKDHFADIGGLQYASYVYHNLGLLKNKVNIYLPKNEIDYSKKIIKNTKECYCNYIEITDNLKISIDGIDLTFKDNKSHSIESFMVKLENENFKIVYTSDIGITNIKELTEYCKNSDLIICESSLLKEYNSNMKTHFTAGDAGKLANNSNSKKLLLTHFWPEEDKRKYLDEAKKVFKETEVAEEGKILTLRRY